MLIFPGPTWGDGGLSPNPNTGLQRAAARAAPTARSWKQFKREKKPNPPRQVLFGDAGVIMGIGKYCSPPFCNSRTRQFHGKVLARLPGSLKGDFISRYSLWAGYRTKTFGQKLDRNNFSDFGA